MLRYRRRQRRLPMIYMPYRPHIYMRLRPLKFLLPHLLTSLMTEHFIDETFFVRGAHDRDRTGDLILTKDVLYQLSYVGLPIAASFVEPLAATQTWSGKRDSNPRPSAWKADALAN
jgi:hypothetical protein